MMSARGGPGRSSSATSMSAIFPSAALGAPSAPTHRVAALRTHAYPGPAIKLPPRMALSLGAQLTIVGREGDFAVSEDGLYLWSRSLAELSANEPDWVAVAERFIETPYLWGGRTSEGIDCSGLVQTALMAGGIASPRDSDMQEATLRRARSPSTTRARRLRAAISCSGRATSGSCAIPSRCFTPTAGT